MNAFNWLNGLFSRRGKAWSLYMRGIAKARMHDHQGAIDDYTTTIRNTATHADLKAMVLYNRALAYVAIGDDRKGFNDLDAILTMGGATAQVKIVARKKLARMES